MTTVNIYLTFNGNCEEAFNFYQSIFGGEFPYVGRFKEMPDNEGYSVPAEDAEKIMHISLPISKETILMGSDVAGESAADFAIGNNFSVSVNTDSKEKADNFFNRLSSGGNVVMAMNQTFWGDYFGMLTDQFGVNWMVSFNESYQT